jgi:hypothetical protein
MRLPPPCSSGASGWRWLEPRAVIPRRACTASCCDQPNALNDPLLCRLNHKLKKRKDPCCADSIVHLTPAHLAQVRRLLRSRCGTRVANFPQSMRLLVTTHNSTHIAPSVAANPRVPTRRPKKKKDKNKNLQKKKPHWDFFVPTLHNGCCTDGKGAARARE